jgi:hypothetical protein
MRKSLWIIFALILVAIAAPNVRADSFTDGTLNFTLVGGGPAPTASFVFDNTTSTFTSFTVRWDGAAWMASGPSTTSRTCAEPPQDLALFFPGLAVVVLGPLAPGTFLVPDAAAFGGYTVSEVEVATPEPSSVALLLVGIGFLLVISKRLSLS